MRSTYDCRPLGLEVISGGPRPGPGVPTFSSREEAKAAARTMPPPPGVVCDSAFAGLGLFGNGPAHAGYAPCAGAAAEPPWLRPWQELFPESRLTAALRAAYVRGGEVFASSRTVGVDLQALGLCVGMWVVDDGFALNYGHELGQLRMMMPESLEAIEDPFTNGRHDDVYRYRDWLLAGQGLVPPIRVVETDRGTFRVTDGHRRWAAHKLLGRAVPAIVWPSMRTGYQDGQGRVRLSTAGLTWEGTVQDALAQGLPVPAAARAVFEGELAKRTGLQERATVMRVGGLSGFGGLQTRRRR